MGTITNEENQSESSIDLEQLIGPMLFLYDYNLKIFNVSDPVSNPEGVMVVNENFNLTNATKIVTFTATNGEVYRDTEMFFLKNVTILIKYSTEDPSISEVVDKYYMQKYKHLEKVDNVSNDF